MYVFLKDLIDWHKLNYKMCAECLYRNNFSSYIVGYGLIKNSDIRKTKLNQIIERIKKEVHYTSMLKYNDLVKRINQGLEKLDQEDNPEKIKLYHEHILRLCKEHDILVSLLKIQVPSKPIEIPYILTI